MQYKKIGNTFVLRLLAGEEVLEKIKELATIENIKAATISGLGAGGPIVIGIFDREAKTHKEDVYEGLYEILSFTGNLSRKDGEPYIHMHLTFSDADNHAYGGHLTKWVITLTAEIFITVLDGELSRTFDNDFGAFVLDV